MRVLHFRVRMLVILLFTAVNPEPVSVIMPFCQNIGMNFLLLLFFETCSMNVLKIFYSFLQ